jgi:hypothetical protein
MARPVNMSRGTSGALALIILGLAGVIAPSLGCNKKDKPEGAQPAASQSPASQSPASQSPASQSPASQSPASQSPASPTAATAPPGDGKLHCDQFLSKDELAALGLAMHPTAPEMSQDILLSCNYDSVISMIWRGGDYYWSSVVGGFKANDATKPDEGPKIGAETTWVTMGGLHVVGFLPANKKFAASVASTDKAKAEKLATALNAKFEKM